MDRYEIAIGKEKEHLEPEAVQTFGFDNELDDIKKRSWKRNRNSDYFSLKYDEKARVGVVYEDSQKLFTGTYTHFCRTYFLCKSTEGNKERCCDYSKRVFRTGCALIVYSEELLHEPDGSAVVSLTEHSPYKIMPWVFGTHTYYSLKEMHNMSSVFNNDIILRRNNETLRTYDIRPTGTSLWHNSTPQIQEKIITEARSIIKGMKEYIGADLSLEEIDELIKNDHLNVATIAATQRSIVPVTGSVVPRRFTGAPINPTFGP
jgi:hypothetical protein